MSNNSFKLKNALTLTPVDLTTLTNPQAGDLACDINDNNKIKRYDTGTSAWTEVGSASAGDVDTLLNQTFDSAGVTSFTQSGLSLITTNPLHGTQSARLIHQSGVSPTNDQYFTQTVSVDPKFRGVNMTASILVRSTASEGNVTLTVTDVTNSATLSTQNIETGSQAIASLTTTISSTTVSGFTNSVINDLRVGMSVTGTGIATGTTIASINTSALTITLSQAATGSSTVTLRFSELPRTVQLGFAIPANCSSISYTIKALPESGLPETYIDDVVFRNYFLGTSVQGQSEWELEIPVVTEWESYTPTFTGMGTVSAVNMRWRQVGGAIEIQGGWTNGTVTASQASFTIPAGVTSSLTNYEIIGSYGTQGTASSDLPLVWHISSGFVVFGQGNWQVFQAGTAMATGGFVTVQATIPITATATETQSIVVNDIVPAKAVLGNTTLEIPSMTDWTSYTPTFTGFGTPSSVEFQWRRNGADYEIRGKFTAGSATATEARISLPNGATSAGTGIIPSIQAAGNYFRGTSVAAHGGVVLIEPSVTYLTFSDNNTFGSTASNSLTKANGNTVESGNPMSLFAKVPISGLTATEEVVVSGTQQALVSQSDSTVSVGTANGFGSTATNIRRYSTLITNIGSDILYADSATLGASFTIQTSGVYSISATENLTGSGRAAISRNQVSLNLGVGAHSNSIILREFHATAAGSCSGSWQGYLVAGDIIRVTTDAIAAGADSQLSGLTITKQGSLQVATVNADQKIKIPTSELRFEGASSRGAVATAIVKFDTLAKIRGDAFTVTNTANDGTYVTMTKAGLLDVAVTMNMIANQGLYISKNQAVLSTTPTASEILNASNNDASSSSVTTVNVSTFVDVGDTIRVVCTAAPASSLVNRMLLSFQEQSVQVSVSNTLPQFSESDSSIRLSGANGYGSTATTTRRFSSVVQNIGTAIEYTDSATLGGQFKALESGIYNVSYTENSSVNAAEASALLNLNGTTVAYDNQVYNTANTNSKVASVSWQGYLTQGDIITAGVAIAANNNGAFVTFTMSKVGKPNVTGVDVTPFIEIPQPLVQTIQLTSGTGTAATDISNFVVSKDTADGIMTYSSGRITFLKKATISAIFKVTATASSDKYPRIKKNGSVAIQHTWSNGSINGTGYDSSVSFNDVMLPGDYLTFDVQNVSTFNNAMVFVTATANSDQILTPPETFSTDTNALTYAGSGTYTLSTLANAPVGTFITFTYAINTNTRTQTTTAPTQTTADMNTNGILLYTRPYNAASTAAQPTAMAIQIGKGLKGLALNLYKSSGKTTSGEVDTRTVGSSSEGVFSASGFHYKSYNELTGILYLDAGNTGSTGTTSYSFLYNDLTTQTSGYLTINASKNPALTGLGLNVVAARGVSSSGQSIPNNTQTTVTWDSAKTFDTHGALNTSTGVYTAPETGYYQVGAGIMYTSLGFNAAEIADIYIVKNGTIVTLTRVAGQAAATVTFSCVVSDVVYLTKGDLLRIDAYQNSGASVSLNNVAQTNYLSIAKVSV